MGGKSGGIIGYKYFVGMHFICCYGPVDEVSQIRCGERVALNASIQSSQFVLINKPDLFGGKDREGGVGGSQVGGSTGIVGGIAQVVSGVLAGGDVYVAMGENTQVPNAYLQNKIDSLNPQRIPAYRGVLGFIFQGFYVGNNPYLKDWDFRVARYPDTLGNAPKNKIGTDANGANMLHELLTNVDWGMGYSVAEMDAISFTAAGDTLFNEGLGLSMIWTGSQPIEGFVDDILRHINGSLYLDLATGLFVLKLIRNDYVFASLPVYDESNIVDMKNFSRRGWGETVNELTVVYRDNDTDKSVPVTVQDMANIQVQGTTINTTRQYPGISNAINANLVALRDLRTLSYPLASVKMRVNRDAWDIAPGDVFRLSWVAFGIVDVVFRVGAIDFGNLKDGHINIDAIEDIFGLPSASYAAPQVSGWVEPSSVPLDAIFQFLEDATYYDMVQQLGEDDAANVAVDNAFLKSTAAKPTSDHYNYQLQVSFDEVTIPYTEEAVGLYAPTATLVAAMELGVVTTFVYEGESGQIEFMPLFTFIQIDNEFMEVFEHDTATNTMKVNRGVVDTVPAPHLIGARLFANQTDVAFGVTQFAFGEILDVKLLGQTGQGTLDLLDATTLNHTIEARKDKPYPPANIQLEGLPAYQPQGMTLGDMDITWEHRDRTQQTASEHVPQVFGDIGPEIGTTYTIRFYDETDTLVRTEIGITITSYTWVDETADSLFPVGRVNSFFRLEIESVISGLVSHQFHNYLFKRADYGYSYGEFYGGFV